MTKNVGGIDRILRGVAGVALLAWGGITGNLLGAIGLVLLLTAVFSFCPAYPLLGINSRKEDQ